MDKGVRPFWEKITLFCDNNKNGNYTKQNFGGYIYNIFTLCDFLIPVFCKIASNVVYQ